VACLLSGGIDSPVAAWRMMRRGCRVLFVHFHSYPILSRASQEKARELARSLTRFQFRSRLFLVPFGEIQQRVVLAVPPPLRVVVYRRLMMRIAERIARTHRAQALVTGDVVGQVASQTLENMATIGSVVTLPVLRPLSAWTRKRSPRRRSGSAPIRSRSSRTRTAARCSRRRIPRPRRSRTRSSARKADLPIDEIVAQAVAAARVEHFRFPDDIK
jgi:thiamine biosynthesis protein ThiI